jgi:hypothetical protein
MQWTYSLLIFFNNGIKFSIESGSFEPNVFRKLKDAKPQRGMALEAGHRTVNKRLEKRNKVRI